MLGRFLSRLRAKPTPIDPREHFLLLVESCLFTLPGVLEVIRVPDDFALDIVTAEGRSRSFLENFYAETREMSPEERQSYLRPRLEDVLRTVGGEEDLDWETARELLLPVIRPAMYGANRLPGVTGLVSDHFIRRRFLPFLNVLVVIDRPSSLLTVTREMVTDWNVELDEVFATANARVGTLEKVELELYDARSGPLWIVGNEDSYETSRLLLPGFLASLHTKVEGNPILILPQRGMLMIGGDARPDAVDRLLEIAEREFAASGRRLSCALYTVSQRGAVVPYLREGSDAQAQRVKQAHEKLAKSAYDEQKQCLEALPEREDVFIATYAAAVSDGTVLPKGTVFSFSTWTKGARTYLPRSEHVLLMTLNAAQTQRESALLVPFDAIQERLAPVPDLDPERYVTGEFPDAAELHRLASLPGSWKAE